MVPIAFSLLPGRTHSPHSSGDKPVRGLVVRRAISPVIESLERRVLLAANFGVVDSNGVLTVTGTSDDNVISLSQTGSSVAVNFDGTKDTFTGSDVQMESSVPEATRLALTGRGHEITIVGPRSSTFGYGQAVMTTPQRVQSGASDPRHDGTAIPQVLPD